jgi:hypothetical protein
VPSGLTPKERSLRASIAANTRWSREDPRPALAEVRAGFARRFEDKVDPDRSLPADERARRARAAMRAHMQSLSLKSAKARRKAGGSG